MGHSPVPPPAPDPVLLAMSRPAGSMEYRYIDGCPTPARPTPDVRTDEGITPGTLIGAALVYQAMTSVGADFSSGE